MSATTAHETPAGEVAPASKGAVDDAGLHKKPELAPAFAVACFVMAIVFLLYGARTFAPFADALLKLARYPGELRVISAGVPCAVALALILEHRRRTALPKLPTYLLLNRAVGYGVLLTLSLHLYLVARDAGAEVHLRSVLLDTTTQLLAMATALGLSAVAYAGFLHPLVDDTDDGLEEYPAAVERLSTSYDFILGAEYPDDWKGAAKGKKRWLLLKEHSLWTNLFVFGGIDSGKTSSLAYPLVLQALRKFRDDPALRPSIVLLDLKGDNALRLYEFCRSLGREEEFWVVSPGNQMLDKEGAPVVDKKGRPIIPRERFLTWNPIGGKEPADLRASLLLDGLSSTNDGPKFSGSAEYFENVESEFLSATVQLMDLVLGQGKATLLDVYLFAYDDTRRKAIVRHPNARGSIAQLYFVKRFAKMKPEDQGHLISGLTAKLAKLTSPSVKATFCPPSSPAGTNEAHSTAAFPGFLDLVVNRPGVVVFSVPEAIYSRALCRVLGIMFMRAFHSEMLQRSTSQFVESGGNAKRLVMNVVDECWAFMNRGVANFTAVSRQARTCSVFLTQSLDQIPDGYRATVEGNFRTKALLSVNDSLTLKRFEELLGTQKEIVKNLSTNASLSSVRHGVFFPTMVGGDQGISQTQSTSEQLRPRFSQHEIQHLPRGRAVVHLYTQEGQREACAMEVTPWFKLAFHLLPLLEHADVGCAGALPSGKRSKLHDYEHLSAEGAVLAGGARCRRCGHEVDQAALAEVAAALDAPLALAGAARSAP